MTDLLSDLRFALRTLARAPGFAAVAVFALALGIGANTTIFTIFNSVLLRPLPYKDPARLVAVHAVVPKFAYLAASVPVNAYGYLEFRKQAKSIEQIAIFNEDPTNLTSGGEPVRLTMARASASLFPTLGIRPQLGRTFSDEEDKAGRDTVVVMSDQLWTERFQRDPGILGRKILLDSKPYEVVGVMPPGFQVPRTSQVQGAAVNDDYPQLWKPVGLQNYEMERLGNFNFGCVARLKPGFTAKEATAELTLIQRSILKDSPETLEVLETAVPLQQQIGGRSRQSLILLLAAVGMVLIVVCVNIANLLLARAAGRRREMAIRTAIGARTSRLVRQTLTESLVLAIAGGALGLLLASLALQLILHRAPVDLPRLSEVRIDGSVAAFALLLTLAAGAFFGALPAWRMARTDPQSALKAGSQTITESRRGGRLRRTLIAAEVALSAMCLAVGGLLLDSFVRVMHVDKGFEAERSITVSLGLPYVRYPKSEDAARFVRSLLERVQQQPGVVAAGESSMLPLGGEGNNNLVAAEGTNPPISERLLVDHRAASPDFFRAMGIPLVKGRMFQDSDANHNVAVISASVARRLWPNADPIGRRYHEGDDKQPMIEVVGVVGDVRGAALQKAPNPTTYQPYWQRNEHTVALVVRTAMAPTAITASVRRIIQSMDRELPIPKFETVAEIVDASVAQRRFQLNLVLLFAAAALLAAAVGVYGVISQTVMQRTNEIGIRMALGASAASVWGMVLRQGLAPVVVGLAAGLAGSLAVGRLVSGLLYGTGTADPLVFAGVAVVLLSAATAACWLPARRATHVDPLVALRYE